MNTNKGTGIDQAYIRATTEAVRPRAYETYAAAKAEPCDFPGCDGTFHEPGVPQSQWAHRSATVEFGGDAEVTLDITRLGSDAPTAQVWLEGVYNDLTAEDLRHLATVYENLPGLMRAQADKLDALTA